MDEARFQKLFRIATKSQGSCRVDWPPQDAVAIAKRLQELEVNFAAAVELETKTARANYEKRAAKAEETIQSQTKERINVAEENMRLAHENAEAADKRADFAEARLLEREKQFQSVQDLQELERAALAAAIAYWWWLNGADDAEGSVAGAQRLFMATVGALVRAPIEAPVLPVD